jgi:hypothetical protein
MISSLVEAQEAHIRAEQFTAVGDNGADRVRLRTGPAIRAGVDVMSLDGALRASIDTGGTIASPNPDGASYTIRGGDGTISLARLGTINNEAARTVEGMVMFLDDSRGNRRARMRVADDGTPSIELLDASNNVIWSAP